MKYWNIIKDLNQKVMTTNIRFKHLLSLFLFCILLLAGTTSLQAQKDTAERINIRNIVLSLAEGIMIMMDADITAGHHGVCIGLSHYTIITTGFITTVAIITNSTLTEGIV
jgi:hypothetical protein